MAATNAGASEESIPPPPYSVHFVGIIKISNVRGAESPISILSEASMKPAAQAAPKNGGFFSSLNSVAFGAADFVSGGQLTNNIESLKAVMVSEVANKELKSHPTATCFEAEMPDHTFYMFAPTRKAAAVLICPLDSSKNPFPKTHAHSALKELYSNFTQKVKLPATELTAESCAVFKPEIERFFEMLKQGTVMMQIRRNLDDTRADLQNLIAKSFIRKEWLDSAVDSTGNLSDQTKAFYTKAKEQNSGCCSVM